MALETIGFQAVVKDLQKYLAAVNQMAASNVKLAQSELRYITAAEAADKRFQNIRAKQIASQAAVTAAVQNGNNRINEFNLRSVNIAERLAQRRIDLEEKLVRTNRTVSQEIRKNGAASVAALERRADAQTRLDNFNINSAARLAAVERARGRLSEQVSDQIAAAELRRLGINNQITRTITTNAIAETRANLALAASRGGFVRSFNLGTAALAPFRLAAAAATKATSLLGSALIAVTGFSNRFAVSLRFGALAITAFTSAFVIREAGQFEQVLAKIDVLTNATAEDVAFLGEEFLRLSETIPKTADELGAAAYFVLSSGINDVNEALEITELAAQAATVGLGTTEEVARVITSVLNAYGKENISAAQATDLLVAAIREGAAEAPDFVQNLGRLLGLAPALGVEFDQLVAAIADLTNVGLPAHQAATALLGIMNQLQSPSQEARDALEEVGTSIEELRATVRERGLIPALVELLGLFGNNVQILEDLFPEVRGLTGALLLLRDESSRYEEILANLAVSSGTTRESFERMSETVGVQADLLKNQLNILFIELGSQVLPTLNNALREARDWFQRNREAIIELITRIGQIISIIVGDFVRGIENINNALAFLPNNSGTIILAITAIGAAMVAAWGPGSLAFAGLFAIVTLLGQLNKETTKFELPQKTAELGDLAERISGLGGFENLPEDVVTRTGVTRPGLPAVRPQPGSPADIQRQEELRLLETRLFAVNERIKQLEELESEGLLGAAGNRTLAEALEDQRKQLEANIKTNQDSSIVLPEVNAQYKDYNTNLEENKELISALSDGIISFAEAQELGIDAITAGALEAGAILENAGEKAFEFEKALSKVANAFQRSADIAKRIVLDIARNALDSVRSATSAVFGRPTREILSLELVSLRAANATNRLTRSLDAQISEIDRQLGRLDRSEAIESLQDQEDAIQDLTHEQGFLRTKLKSATGDEAEDIVRDLGKITAELNRAGVELDRERLRQSLEDQKAAIEGQISAQEAEQQAIEDKIQLLNDENKILQLSVELADQTLLTQEELRTKASELSVAMFEASGSVRSLSDQLGIDIIPEMEDMHEALLLLNGTIAVLNNESLRDGFIRQVDAATFGLEKFNEALGISAEDLANSVETILEQFEVLSQSGFGAGTVVGQQHGGLITKPTTTLRGEHHLPELVLPLSEPMRSRELMMSLPTSLIRQITPSQAPQIGSLIGGVSVQGIITPEIDHMVNIEVRRQLNRAKAGLRSIGLRSIGL